MQRLRERFPRARWSDSLNAWFVPGTARRRIGRWLAEMEVEAETFADEKGRDAFAFDPIESRYLGAGRSGFYVRTPYSRIVVNEIREISFARWDADGTEEEEASKATLRERRRRRYPVLAGDVPPFERAIGTHAGVFVFTGMEGEMADPATVSTYYFPANLKDEHVWASWRPGSLEELLVTWPARTPPGEQELARGWWLPVLEELRIARQKAKSKRRAQQRRQGQDGTAS